MGRPFGFASTVGRMNRLLGLPPGVGRSCTNATLNGIIPSAGKMGPTVIDKSQPIESIGSRLYDHARTFHSGVCARFQLSRTLPAEGIHWT